MLIYRSEFDQDGKEIEFSGCNGLAERLQTSGHWKAGAALQPVSTATSIRLRGGKRQVTDGPFAETREQLAGYMLIHAETREEAIDIAAQHPISEVGTIEIRPLRDLF
jgi:hypothetical protein